MSDAFAERRYEDRSTALRQLVDFALRELATREAVESVEVNKGDVVALRCPCPHVRANPHEVVPE